MKQYINIIITLPFSIKWLLLTEMFYGFAMGIWGINLNFHLADKGLNDASIGSIIAFGSIVTAVFSLIVGGLCDRFGYKHGMVLGCIIRAVGIVVMAMASRHELILAGQILFSIGGAFIYSSEFPLMLSLLKDEHMQVSYNLSFCVYQFAMFFGNLTGGIMPGWMHYQLGRYGMSIMLCGILFVLMGIGRHLLPSSPKIDSDNKFSFSIVRQRMIVWFLLFGLCIGVLENIILPLSMINTIYRDIFKLSDNAIGIMYSLSTIISCIAYFIAPLILERWNNTLLTQNILILNAFFFVLLSFVRVHIFIGIWLGFSFFSSILTGSAESHMLKSIPHHKRGAYSGLAIFANCIGMGIGAGISGIFLTYLNYSALMFFGSAIALFQIFIYNFGCSKYLSLEMQYSLQAVNVHALSNDKFD